MNRLRGVALLLIQSVITPVHAILMILAIPLGGAVVFAIAKRWCSLNVSVGQLLGMRFEVEYEAPLPDRAAVILSKHSSAWETFFIVRTFPRLVPVAKRELLWVPFFGWGLALCNPIAIDRSARREARNQVNDQGRDRLGRGLWVMIFPEGTRIPPGQRGRYASGGAGLAIAAGAPVVAMAHDAGYYWRKPLFDKRAGTIRAVISAPMWPQPGESATALTRRAEQWIEARIESFGHPPAEYTARSRAALARSGAGAKAGDDDAAMADDAGGEEVAGSRAEGGPASALPRDLP